MIFNKGESKLSKLALKLMPIISAVQDDSVIINV